MDLVFRIHAVRRMAERRVTTDEVREVIDHGEIIERYPEDRPLPSVLANGTSIAGRPIHVVFATDVEAAEIIVITVYEPDPELWEEGFQVRRR